MKYISIQVHSIPSPVKFIIGQNRADNDQVVACGHPQDIWFHAADDSSCHVVASISAECIDKKQLRHVVKAGAILCKQYTKKLASSKRVRIHYARIQYVNKTDIVGMVSISQDHCREIEI